MEEAKSKSKSKKRKRKVPKEKPVPTVSSDERHEMIEKLYLYISSIEVQVSAIKRLLLEHA